MGDDEHNDREGARSQLLPKMRKLQQRTNVRPMATSRFILEIAEESRSAPQLEVRAGNEDVRQSVAGQMPRLPKYIQRDEKLRRKLTKLWIEGRSPLSFPAS